MQYVSSRSYRVRAEIEAQSGSLSPGYKPVGGGLIASNVHIPSRMLLVSLYAISGRNRRLCMLTIVPSRLKDCNVCLSHHRLPGELLPQEVASYFKFAVEEPADDAQSEHVPTLELRLVVELRVLQGLLHHLRYWASNDTVGINSQLIEIVSGLELCLLQVSIAEAVGINDYCRGLLGVLYLRLKCRGIHSHKHITLVAGRQHLVNIIPDVHLIAADTCQGPLRSTYVSRIVRECGYAIPLCCRYC